MSEEISAHILLTRNRSYWLVVRTSCGRGISPHFGAPRRYKLYVVLDVFSRYIVGWTIAPYESAALAKDLITVRQANWPSTGGVSPLW